VPRVGSTLSEWWKQNGEQKFVTWHDWKSFLLFWERR
jgi:hypothetical protein